MRVLSILWGFSLGGIGKYATMLATLNENYNIQLDTICIQGSAWDCDLEPLKAIGATILQIAGRTDLSWIRQCGELIVNIKPDIVYVHGFNGPVVARLCQHKLKTDFPFVCSYHGLYHASKLSRMLLAPLFNFGAEYIYKNYALGIVTVSQYCKNYLLARAIPENKIAVIHNGIPDLQGLDQALEREQIALSPNDFVIGVASRLDPVKGVEYLIDAFPGILRKVPNAKLVLVGRGTCEARLRWRCDTLNVGDAVVFAGYQDNVASWLNILAVFVLPSLAEYHSVGLLEAMRAGLPIVATNVGGNPESIEHGKEGLLVPPKDPKALEVAICELALQPNRRRQLGKAVRARFERDFTQERTLERTASWLLSFDGGNR